MMLGRFSYPLAAIGLCLIAGSAIVTCNDTFSTSGGSSGGPGGSGECAEDTDCPAVGACIDARCLDGQCTIELRNCNDGNPCTLNTCDPGLDECTSVTANEGFACGSNAVCAAGSCECLDGFENCDGELGCESRLASDASHCGECGKPCSSGEACIDSVCDNCSDNAHCDDGLSCTVNTCADGACSHELSDGYCLIAGQCYAAAQRNPANDCESCQPHLDTESWSLRSGLCEPANGCGTGTCQEDGNCEMAPGHCYIDGKCYTDGESNDCAVCDSQQNPYGWSCRRNDDGGVILPGCCPSPGLSLPADEKWSSP